MTTQIYGNLRIVGSHHLPHHQALFVNEWGESFEFGLCKHIQDKSSEGMSCITHCVVFHAYLRRSKILLAFTRHQVMYSVFGIVPFRDCM